MELYQVQQVRTLGAGSARPPQSGSGSTCGSWRTGSRTKNSSNMCRFLPVSMACAPCTDTHAPAQISPQQSLAPALAQGLLEKAAALLSRFLSVVPVQGSLFVARGCSEKWDSGPHAGACRTLAVGAPRCGPTPHVPAEHVGPAITLARGQAGDWIATQHAGGAGMVRPRARSLGAVPKRPCASTRAVSSRGRRRAQTCSCTSPPSTRGRAPPRARWRMRRRASATRTTALWWSVRLQRPAVHTAA